MIGDFPAHVQAKIRRILAAEARRLLHAEQANRDPAGTATNRSDDRALDGRSDQLTPSGER